MRLSELFLNRFLYRDNKQDLETKDSSFIAADSSEDDGYPISSGGAAQDINTGNVQIDGGQIEEGTLPLTVLDVANWGWSQDCAFSSTNLNTVSWGSGIFTSASGDTYAISAGNTGNMSAKTYIYLSLLDSETVYQTTTTSADSVGTGKVLIAVAENATDDATYNLTEANQIVGDNILANTIDASKITTGTLIVGTNVQIGTAEDAAGVTTIIGNTITTGYITALSLVVGTEIGLGTAEDAAGVTTIVGNTITTGYVNALSITVIGTLTAGNINASVVTVSNINANNITTGNVSSARISTVSLSAVRANISTLSSLRANLGSITAGTIAGVTFNVSSDININNGVTNVLKLNKHAFICRVNKALALEGSTPGVYTQFYGSGGDGIIELNNDSSGNLKIMNANSTVNLFTVNTTKVTVYKPFKLLITSSPPAGAENGWMFYHSTWDEVWVFKAGAWRALAYV